MSRDQLLRDIAARHGTPFYAHFLDDVAARIDTLRTVFGGRFAISYAVKSNPARELLRWLNGRCDLLDVSSGGELQHALDAGWPAHTLSFTGPGKTRKELELAVSRFGGAGDESGEVVLESVDEAQQLAQLARAAGKRVRVLVRLSPTRVPPGFGDTMAGKPTAFGIDEEDLEASLRAIVSLQDALHLVGFHAYSGTQCLKPMAIVENYRIFIELFLKAIALTGCKPEKLIFGSGLGIVYHEGQEPLDIDIIAREINPDLDALKQKLPDTQLVIETGRYLVGEAGVLVTRVLRTKDSRGSRIGICDAGINHHLAASGLFGMAIRRNYKMRNISADGPAAGSYQLSGPLCTSIDVLARGIALSRLEAGDLIVIGTSGAYGATASLGRFISHPPVGEWLIDSDGVVSAN